MMTDIVGLLKDKDDPTTLIPTISVKQAKSLLDDGTISGGMIPKIKCCIDAISHGVKNVTIMDGRIPHSILMELLTNEGAGTEVVADNG
jgi:acetylglutamate kinase